MPKYGNEHHGITFFLLVLRQTKVVKVRFNLQELFCWRHSFSESTPDALHPLHKLEALTFSPLSW